MKRNKIVASFIVFAFSLSACGSGSTNTPEPSITAPSTQTTNLDATIVAQSTQIAELTKATQGAESTESPVSESPTKVVDPTPQVTVSFPVNVELVGYPIDVILAGVNTARDGYRTAQVRIEIRRGNSGLRPRPNNEFRVEIADVKGFGHTCVDVRDSAAKALAYSTRVTEFFVERIPFVCEIPNTAANLSLQISMYRNLNWQILLRAPLQPEGVTKLNDSTSLISLTSGLPTIGETASITDIADIQLVSANYDSGNSKWILTVRIKNNYALDIVRSCNQVPCKSAQIKFALVTEQGIFRDFRDSATETDCPPGPPGFMWDCRLQIPGSPALDAVFVTTIMRYIGDPELVKGPSVETAHRIKLPT